MARTMVSLVGRRRLSVMKLMATVLLSSLLLTDANNLRFNRKIQATVTQSFDVNLFLALHFVNGQTASELETKDPSNAVVQHFCEKVQEQVSENEAA